MAATPISLALRGGAALVIDGIGGASAGAINACGLAQGLPEGGPVDGYRRKSYILT